MSKIQLDRLRNDLTELTNYMEKNDLLAKLKRKHEFLKSKLEQV